jgi:predicted nicotinamide N-methyase
MVSFTLSLIGVELVITTELEDILNTNTKNNLILNNLQNEKNIILLPLEWNNKAHIDNIFNLYPHLDYIILSECLYEEAPFDKLLFTLIKLSKFYKNVVIFFTYKKRYIFQEKCIEELKKFFTIENIDRNEIHQDFRNLDNYQFFKIKLI